jgi:hypothetical protein
MRLSILLLVLVTTKVKSRIIAFDGTGNQHFMLFCISWNAPALYSYCKLVICIVHDYIYFLSSVLHPILQLCQMQIYQHVSTERFRVALGLCDSLYLNTISSTYCCF